LVNPKRALKGVKVHKVSFFQYFRNFQFWPKLYVIGKKHIEQNFLIKLSIKRVTYINFVKRTIQLKNTKTHFYIIFNLYYLTRYKK
jgi:hypothetical protein